MEPTIITIIADRLPEAVKELKRLAAKAERYGCPTITWSVGEPREERRMSAAGRRVTVMVTDVTLDALEAPRVGPFRFLARLERTPAGTIIDSIPGETLPEKFRHSDGMCEHCRTARDRRHLFVVARDGEEPLQVGRSCLRDYMGTDTPEIVASRFRWERELREFSEGQGGVVTDSAAELLAVTAVAIRLWGWVPRAAASEDLTPTSSRIGVWFYPPKKPNQDLEDLRANISDADWEEAAATMEWVQASDDNSEYMHNLRMVLSSGVVEPKRRGYACSAVAARQRAMGLLEIRRREAEAVKDSAHVGMVGERLRGLELTVMSARGMDSRWGTTILYKMRDAGGNVFTWFSPGGAGLGTGKTIKLDATVKAHGEYKGVRETVLTRAKEV